MGNNFMDVDHQLEVITMGTVEIIPLDEMKRKLKRSKETGVPLKIKLGVDPTRPDLHIGHVVPLQKLRHFQELGHKVILIIGDFTARIGDPSNQDVTRPQLSLEEVKINAETYVNQAAKIIDTDNIDLRYNSSWLEPLSFQDVVKLTSRFTVARLLERDDFAIRYREGKPLGLHEFLYPVMQAYDSVALEADVEIGGTDQKFNFLAARDLQRSFDQEPQCIVTLPLLEGVDGVKKMSKSMGNDICLMDTPEQMFGKTMSIPDHMMWKYFELATKVPTEEIEELRRDVQEGKVNPREAKDRLAMEIVGLYHGKEGAIKASEEFRRVFSEGRLPSTVDVCEITKKVFKKGKASLVDILVSSELAPSRSEARRLIKGGAIEIEGVRYDDPEVEMDREDISGKILRRGKKIFVKIIVAD